MEAELVGIIKYFCRWLFGGKLPAVLVCQNSMVARKRICNVAESGDEPSHHICNVPNFSGKPPHLQRAEFQWQTTTFIR